MFGISYWKLWKHWVYAFLYWKNTFFICIEYTFLYANYRIEKSPNIIIQVLGIIRFDHLFVLKFLSNGLHEHPCLCSYKCLNLPIGVSEYSVVGILTKTLKSPKEYHICTNINTLFNILRHRNAECKFRKCDTFLCGF